MVSFGRWKLYWWYEEPAVPEAAGKPGKTGTINGWRPCGWLAGPRRDSGFRRALRRLLLQKGSGDLFLLHDEQVLDAVARKVATGEVRILEWHMEPRGGFGALVTGTSNPFPLNERKAAPASSSKTSDDDDLFPSDALLVAIADILKDAAQSGVPFCEECAKAAQSA